MMATALAKPSSEPPGYTSVPLSGLAASDPLAFPIYLRTANDACVLYRPATSALDASHLGRLQAEGVANLFIRDGDRELYLRRVGNSLEHILHQRGVPLEERAEVLCGIANQMADELLEGPVDRAGIAKAQKVMMATSGLMLREVGGFAAIRKMMSGSSGLAHHALTVSFLSMGLSRVVLGADANGLMVAGMAGLLHDVGKVGHEASGADPDHTVRGADYLEGLGVPGPVVQAALSHHERWDGTGFPQGLRGQQIPPIARVVGLVNTFDKVYTSQRPKVGVFDALRILAQAYRGCFDNKLASGLVQLFR